MMQQSNTIVNAPLPPYSSVFFIPRCTCSFFFLCFLPFLLCYSCVLPVLSWASRAQSITSQSSSLFWVRPPSAILRTWHILFASKASRWTALCATQSSERAVPEGGQWSSGWGVLE